MLDITRATVHLLGGNHILVAPYKVDVSIVLYMVMSIDTKQACIITESEYKHLETGVTQQVAFPVLQH